MKSVLQDTNKGVTAAAIRLVAKIARAMGRPIAREVRPALSLLVKNASDANKMIREAVIGFLQELAAVAPITGGEMSPSAAMGLSGLLVYPALHIRKLHQVTCTCRLLSEPQSATKT